jgi:lysozyme family protein
MSQAFDGAFEWILEAEGVDANDPFDPGGCTRFGISQRFHPLVNVASLTLEQARDIYRRDYWNAVRGDELPELLALAAFDGVTQHEIEPRLFQRALRVREDGIVGPRTIAAAQQADPHEFLIAHLRIRARYYMELTQLTPRLERFLDGWLNRLFRLHARALSLKGES